MKKEETNIELISDQHLPKQYMRVMNDSRKKNFGPKETKNFKKDYLPGAKFFFIKNKKGILAFGTLRKIIIFYKNKRYDILGLCNVVSVKKGKGYGGLLMQAIIKYIKKTKKTCVGFCRYNNSKFYKKMGLNVKKNFSLRFALRNPKTGKLKFDEPCYGVYLNGKDNLIRKMSSRKDLAYYYLADAEKNPNW